MFTNLNVFRMAHAMAVHAGQRQSVIAQNVANADTPGYQARDIEPFARHFSDESGAIGLRSSRPGHLDTPNDAGKWETFTSVSAAEPNQNTVSVEQEMLKGVEVRRQHDRALAIYRSSLNILRTSLGRA